MLERPAWSNPKVLTTLLLVYLTGVATGALAMRYDIHERFHRSGPGIGQANKTQLLERCKKDLDLTPDQAHQMAVILDDYAKFYQTLQDQLADVRASGKSRIMAVLNDQQRQKFEHMMTDLQKP